MKRRNFLIGLGLLPVTKIIFDMVPSWLSSGVAKVASAKNGQPVLSGIKSLDLIKGGFYPGELTILAGRPSIGKTSVALNIARNISLSHDRSVALYSIEMGKEQIMTRLLAVDSGVGLSKIRSGKLGDDAFDKLIKSSERMSLANLRVIDNYGMTAARMGQTIVRGARLDGYKKPDLIIVDYFQLMKSDFKHASRARECDSILIDLKRIAVEHNLPVVLLSQLNRGAELRSDRRPLMSDLRECSLANSSVVDSAILLHRESYYSRQLTAAQKVIEFNVVKNSFGKTGVAHASWSDINFQIT